MRLEFEEVLRGFVGPGPSSAEGFESGRRTGAGFSFRATATIEDLDAFEADPEHRVHLQGHVEWAPLGRGRLLEGSELRLFVPRPAGRALVYRLAFASGGRRLELRGEKRLGRLPSFRALTTLYVELCEADRPEPVARGILRVPPAEALRFALHVRVPGRGPVRSLGPALRFLRFSQRELRAPLPPSPAPPGDAPR